MYVVVVVGEYWWVVYLLFLAIPLSRIIPRLVARGKRTDDYNDYKYARGSDAGVRSEPAADLDSKGPSVYDAPKEDFGYSSKPPTDDMVVLGALYTGANTFDGIKKKTGLDDDKLNHILEDLEERRQIQVVQKKGLFGEKVEIHPTDDGFRKYYS